MELQSVIRERGSRQGTHQGIVMMVMHIIVTGRAPARIIIAVSEN